MNLRKIVIAIDGYSACGKSTTAKTVANVLGYRYIDTGAMYRAVTYYFLEHHVSLTNPREVSKALQDIHIAFKLNGRNDSETFLNGLNI
jgi:cytidylate kinase